MVALLVIVRHRSFYRVLFKHVQQELQSRQKLPVLLGNEGQAGVQKGDELFALVETLRKNYLNEVLSHRSCLFSVREEALTKPHPFACVPSLRVFLLPLHSSLFLPLFCHTVFRSPFLPYPFKVNSLVIYWRWIGVLPDTYHFYEQLVGMEPAPAALPMDTIISNPQPNGDLWPKSEKGPMHIQLVTQWSGPYLPARLSQPNHPLLLSRPASSFLVSPSS